MNSIMIFDDDYRIFLRGKGYFESDREKGSIAMAFYDVFKGKADWRLKMFSPKGMPNENVDDGVELITSENINFLQNENEEVFVFLDAYWGDYENTRNIIIDYLFKNANKLNFTIYTGNGIEAANTLKKDLFDDYGDQITNVEIRTRCINRSDSKWLYRYFKEEFERAIANKAQ